MGKPLENHRKMVVFHGILWELPSGNDQQFAIENCHRNMIREFSQKIVCSIAMLNYQRVVHVSLEEMNGCNNDQSICGTNTALMEANSRDTFEFSMFFGTSTCN